MLPPLHEPWPQLPFPPIDERRAWLVVENATGLRVEDWVGLHGALIAEAHDLTCALGLAMIHTPLTNLDRFHHIDDPYKTEIEPLLQVMVGSRLGPIHDIPSLRGALEAAPIAMELTTLATHPVRGDLTPAQQSRLDAALARVSDELRRGTVALSGPLRERDRSQVIKVLADLGRLRQAEVLAGVRSGTLDAFGVLSIAKVWRRLHHFDEAISLTTQLIDRNQSVTAALTARAAARCDAGDIVGAHIDAMRSFEMNANPYNARVLLRTSKEVGDKRMSALASHVLDQGRTR